ncbi:alpha/beta hydrolase [Limnohabitans sp. Rim8]|uniref:alpha/beta fold hydrolase n=1 Tax=Limnohabitans sp. Rim8 TaxID=1100718 RepID=UPI00261988B2|nr:alpha/beta hydrolase [Limnohabitans sp. Rim8]
MNKLTDVASPLPLPAGVQSRYVSLSTGLQMHLLEAGQVAPGGTRKPLLLLLHGFPELAYSWRHQLTALAQAGFHVVAPDQRGYGRSTGSDDRYEGDWRASNMPNLVSDVLALLHALGYTKVHAVIGHDFGSPVAAWCALMHPDVFQSVVMMSAPFGGPPDAATATQAQAALSHEVQALQQLVPARQHYQWYYSSAQANDDMWHAPQGLHDFLRAYYHVKSADWSANQPMPLKAWQAVVLAALPHYYVMPYPSTMADAVAPFMPTASQIQACTWLTDSDLAVYVAEYARRGFQGGLQWYRCSTDRDEYLALSRFSGQRIIVPSAYIAGAADWGIYQSPGAFERMQNVCTQLRICQILPGAGHWVQQEQAEAVNQLLLEFVGTA